MHSYVLAAVSAFAAGAVASATPCMSDAQASKVANNFRALIHEPFSTPLAQNALTTDFTDYSDSVIELINGGCDNTHATLGQPTFNSQAAFIAGQSAQPPIPFEILKLWHSCDTVFMRWTASAPGFVQPEEEVTGNIVLEAVSNSNAANRAKYPWQIQTVYSEFNSGAWLVDIGNFTPKCDAQGNGPPPPPSANKRSIELLAGNPDNRMSVL